MDWEFWLAGFIVFGTIGVIAFLVISLFTLADDYRQGKTDARRRNNFSGNQLPWNDWHYGPRRWAYDAGVNRVASETLRISRIDVKRAQRAAKIGRRQKRSEERWKKRERR